MSSLQAQTLSDPLPADPLRVAADWLKEAESGRVQPNPNAMVLATVAASGSPSSRVVLCKGIVLPAGYLVFYSNYQSRKGEELAARPRVATLFHWDDLHRQVRIEGVVEKSAPEESDRYFASRAWQSRLGAWASEQSRPIGSRAALIEALRAVGRRFNTPPVGPEGDERDDPSVVVPRPPHWGGYRLWADAVELWVEGEYRIHDRARYTRTLTPGSGGAGFLASPWQAGRLQP